MPPILLPAGDGEPGRESGAGFGARCPVYLFESVHNRRYWQRRPVLGAGPGAWSSEPRSTGAPFGARRANERDPDGKSLQAAYRLIEAAVAGVQGRDGSRD